MKTVWMLGLMLLGSACATTSYGRGASAGLEGKWRGVLERGALSSVVELRLTDKDGRVTGTYWNGGPEPVFVTDVTAAPRVHFEVPQLATFDGVLDGDTLAGTFKDAQGGGSFRLARQHEVDGAYEAAGTM